MKKIVYIASIIAGILLATSCQKDEMERMGVNHEAVQSSEKVDDAEATHSDIHSDEIKGRVVHIEEVDISVKEVSDGDDESDDDENVAAN